MIVPSVSAIDTTCSEWMSLITVISKDNNSVKPSFSMVARGSSCALDTTSAILSSDSDGASKSLAEINFLIFQMWKVLKNTVARNTVINTHLIVQSMPPKNP